LEVTPNPAGERRTATVRVGDLAFVVAQSANCVFAVTPGTASAPAAGGTAEFAIQTGAGCAWSAAAAEPWVTLQGASGQGPGTVRVAVAPNASPGARSVSLLIAGVTVSLRQDALNCVFDVHPPGEQVLDARGGTFSVRVDTGNACSWTASTGAGWIRLSRTESIGSNTVTVSASANDSSPRSSTVLLAGRSISVRQRSDHCEVRISPRTINARESGGTFFLDLTTEPDCSWQTSGVASWISIGLDSSTGPARISVSVESNPITMPRSTTFRIGGVDVTVRQEALEDEETFFTDRLK
jgi:hypothetical protein